MLLGSHYGHILIDGRGVLLGAEGEQKLLMELDSLNHSSLIEVKFSKFLTLAFFGHLHMLNLFMNSLDFLLEFQ